jgi:hypothetical protein
MPELISASFSSILGMTRLEEICSVRSGGAYKCLMFGWRALEGGSRDCDLLARNVALQDLTQYCLTQYC